MLSRTHYTFYIINYFAIIWTTVEALPTSCPAEVSSIRTLKHYLQGVTLISWTRLVRNNTLPWLYSFGENPSDLYNMCESVLSAGLGEVESENFSGWGTIIQWPILSPPPECESKAPFITDEHMDVKYWNCLSSQVLHRYSQLSLPSCFSGLSINLTTFTSPPFSLYLFLSLFLHPISPFSPLLSPSVLPLLNSLPC